MAKNTTKPKVNLKEVKKQGQLFERLKAATEIPSGHQQINPYLAYLAQEQNLSENELKLQQNMYKNEPTQVGTFLRHYLGKHQDSLIKEVSKDPRIVLSKLEDQTLVQLAVPHIGDKNYKVQARALESKDSSAIGNVMMALYQSESWQMAVSNASATTLEETLTKEVSRAQREHMAKDLGYNSQTGKINKAKTSYFLAPKITTDEQKLQIGLLYTSQSK